MVLLPTMATAQDHLEIHSSIPFIIYPLLEISAQIGACLIVKLPQLKQAYRWSFFKA